MILENYRFLYVPVEGTQLDLLWGLLELGVNTKSYPEVCPVAEYDQEQVEALMEGLGDAEIILTLRFSMVVAEACYRKQRLYISWIWDSPQKELYVQEAKYETNRIFVFDHKQQKRLLDFGLKNVFYEPLAVNLTRISAIQIMDEDNHRFSNQIAFVGNLRRVEQRERFLESLQGRAGEYIKENIEKEIGTWGHDLSLYQSGEDELFAQINKGIVKDSVDLCVPDKYLVQTMFSDEISYRDRIIVLNTLARAFQIALYTQDGMDDPNIDQAVYRYPQVSYDVEMTKVFHLSKINLNVTKRSIEDGVPLRVFDIMGAGGFALSDERTGIRELFEVGKEIETYSCIEELEEKTAFYLIHEQKRIKIAYQGYQKVKENHTYPEALKRMLSVINI